MNKEKLTGLGGIVAAVIGSVCCVGPVILGGLGFGVGAISFARGFGFLHVPMMVLAFLLLGTAFYIRFRNGNKENPIACEVTPGKRPRGNMFLWVATGLTLILLFYPWTLQAEPAENSKVEILQQYQLKVSGLKCESCIPDVRKSLKRVDGVRSAEITQFDKAGSTTVVETVPGKVEESQLVSALKSDGFQAEIVSVDEPREVVLQTESGFSFFGLFD